MLTIDCRDILSVRNELLVYVADKVEAIPTLKNQQFTLSTLDDRDNIDPNAVILAIKEYLISIGEGKNFAVISNNDLINITSISGKTIEKTTNSSQDGMFSCTHCGFITQYQTELNVHMRIHYL
ncbi:C2H2-type zinc finger protein [Nitrosopumilus sp.]|uniref:C2H2-type zinc finger protein n=1 Tax=Nitrosopumilus sp. TaxID=2024843 RepID=UPI0034A04EF8